LAAALRPLRAYREEIRSQQSMGRETTAVEECLDTVEKCFRAALMELEDTG
jgi:hypothetical protein